MEHIPPEPQPDSGQQPISWTEEALKRMENAPAFLRGMAMKLAEKKARQEGISLITVEKLTQWKNETMGMVEAPTEAGGLFWTTKAKDMLETIPEFMRGITKRIAEDFARERGHLEVNAEMFSQVEALGLIEDTPSQEGLPWTDGALKRLSEKVQNTPALATEFVTAMLKRDAEELAREKDYTEITEEVLTRIWDEPQSEVAWSPEAWKRLQTAPDFVRSGIKKAAERRARKMKATVITSDLLTQFRNHAMMKAVMRIRSFGYKKLTFEAFEDAMKKVKRLQNNPEAEKRLQEIKAYMEKKGEVGLLGEELMEKFRKYLEEGIPMKD